MVETKLPVAVFEANRAHLAKVAYRILGARHEADDAIQEAWLRVHGSDISGIDNLRAWLTTVVARICLDRLRSTAARREDVYKIEIHEREDDSHSLPDRDLQMSDAVATAMFVVLETLTPAERVAFVLHDIFGLPFEEIAAVLERSPVMARQLASRARRKLHRHDVHEEGGIDPARTRRIVDAFLRASRDGA